MQQIGLVLCDWPEPISFRNILANKVEKTGWWFQPLWKILVSWDYYPQDMEMFQTTATNQIMIDKVMIDDGGILKVIWI